MMVFIGELAVSALIVIGAFFLLVGSIGLAKLPDIMRRLHAPTKSTTLGIGAILIASMLYFALFLDAPSLHELLITLFLFLTAPVTAFMIAKAHILRDRPTQQALPPTLCGTGWATLHRPPAPGERDGEAPGAGRPGP
ncbi:Na+/H+ antiporter subunit G [Arenibaculum sp.]|jgi:multicomponent K+:H+ antiporter subunit G|uniref:Na+/H+ antiporter subunit G n=1 Tax=Arenibaculum sp. TaxID=2865862 RepID=UPI002E100816|nr:Na+/H+ antiporter subunit G [Arenibaculum sp.]